MKLSNPLKGKSGTQIASYVLFSLSALILAGTIYANMNIDVLKNWRLVLPEQKIHVGDEVVVQSLYEKTMNVSGKSVRYIECKNKSDVYIRYPISEAVADRAAEKAGTGVVIIVPQVIPDLPATCRFNITIEYKVLPWRNVIESMNSEEFTLHAKETTPSGELQETNRTESVENSQGLSSSSSSNNTLTPIQNQRNISQGDEISMPERQLEPTPEPAPEPNLLERILSPITNLLGGNNER